MKELENFIKNRLEILSRTNEAFKDSLNRIANIDIENLETWQDWEPIDAFLDRFERLVDFILNQVFRLIYFIEEKDKSPTKKQVFNLMLKIGIIENIDQIIEILNLRNKLAHEYIGLGIHHTQDIIDDIISNSSLLFKIIENVKTYFKNN